MVGLIVFFAGTQMQTQKDPRKAVGRDVDIMSTYYEHARMKKPRLILTLVKDRKKARKLKKKSKSRKDK